MLTVKLYVNEREIASYSAVRKYGNPGELCTYRLEGSPIAWLDHHYDDGAEALAVKVLLHQLTSKRGV